MGHSLSPQPLSPAQMRLAATLILSSYSTRTIEFFLKIYPHLLETSLSCKEMAEVYGRTPQAVSMHVRTLTEGGYLRRVHYRAWSLGPHPLEREINDKPQTPPEVF